MSIAEARPSTTFDHPGVIPSPVITFAPEQSAARPDAASRAGRARDPGAAMFGARA
ncbi:hypothetical protein [Thiocapsa marina]|uniref:Uncharacterized protein n=1 Tax=Thiocapsa marina 5811 TaxID=768671 RepID=F9UH52_9GAMM|nr:hypothetical protein [Thiocapsa marina]EGV16456.1 hypothetical protein ThimaDRAFT_4225 [Thiocapsa marina 5811]